MIPTNLKYTSKVESSVSKSYRTNVQPQGGTGPYLLGDTIIINVPTRPNLCLCTMDSFLKFKMNITSQNAANNFRMDGNGAHSIIRRCRVFSGSNLLEDIDSYNMLAKIMNDLYVPTDSVYGKLNASSGTRNDLVTTTINGTAFVASTTLSSSCFQTNSGDLVGSGSQYTTATPVAPNVVGVGFTVSDTYCINLISIMGALCQNNYFPLFACSSAPIRIELTLASNISDIVLQKVTSATANTINFTNVEYVAQFIELGDSAMQSIYDSLAQESLQFVASGYRNYQFNTSIPNNVSTQIQMPIPAKFSSLKSIVVSQRDQYGVATFFPYSSVSMGIQNYQWRCGSVVLPSKPPETIPEMFQELCKVAGSLADLNYQPSIEKFTYQYYNSSNATITTSQTLGTGTISVTVDAAGTIANCNSGSFYVGVDFENYPSSEKSKIFSGYNSNNDDIYFNPTYLQVVGSTQTLRYDAFANFDMVLVFEANTCYSKF